MASTSETGSVKNVENFSKLIVEVQGMTAYNPTEADLKITNLQTKETASITVVKNVNDDEGKWKAKINDRQDAYEKMNTLAQRAVGVAASIDLNSKIVADLNSVKRELTGKRKKKLPKEPEPIPAINAPAPITASQITISVAQTSFDKRKDNFSKLIGLLQTISAYNPNEADIKIAGLNSYVASLKTVNTDVRTTAKDLFNSRRLRNIELYKEKSGLVDIALRVKEYVKGMTTAGASSVEYKRIKAIRFKDLALTEKESK